MFNFPTAPEKVGDNRIVSFFSATPGAGSTTLAAVAASRAGGETCVIDLSHGRKLRSYLGMPASDYTYSVVDFQHAGEEEIAHSAAEHPAGFKVIPGPVGELDVAMLTSELALKILRRTKRVFKLTVVVAPPLWGAGWMVALLSDTVVYVMRPERVDLDMFHEHADLFARLGAGERLKIVLNQAKKPGTLNAEEVLKMVGKADAVIPYSENVARQLNRRVVPELANKDVLGSLLS